MKNLVKEVLFSSLKSETTNELFLTKKELGIFLKRKLVKITFEEKKDED